MFRARLTLLRFKITRTQHFCTNTSKSTNSNNNSNNNNKLESEIARYNETYRQLNNLDFMTAAKILFTEPPKKKKFGIDFHLVQLFFACLPSLAVYLVAQYARGEMKKMDAELARKKKEEEEKAKEAELKALEEQKALLNPDILEVKERLDKLEEAVKEIAVESKKQSSIDATSGQVDCSKGKHIAETEPSNVQSTSESIISKAKTNHSQHPDAIKQDQKSKTQNEGTAEDTKQ